MCDVKCDAGHSSKGNPLCTCWPSQHDLPDIQPQRWARLHEALNGVANERDAGAPRNLSGGQHGKSDGEGGAQQGQVPEECWQEERRRYDVVALAQDDLWWGEGGWWYCVRRLVG